LVPPAVAAVSAVRQVRELEIAVAAKHPVATESTQGCRDPDEADHVVSPAD
jgi:hypothetical protein